MKVIVKIIWKLNKLFHKLSGKLRSIYYSNIFKSCGYPRPKIARHVDFSKPENFSCGSNLIVNPQVYFASKGGITLGDNVIISAGAKILSSSLVTDEKTVVSKHIHKAVNIGNNVWIGAGAIVCPGVTIGDNTIVAAGAIVTKDLPGGFIYAGIPAKVLRPLGDKSTAVKTED